MPLQSGLHVCECSSGSEHVLQHQEKLWDKKQEVHHTDKVCVI